MEAAKDKANEAYAELKTEGISSRDAMLRRIRENQPLLSALPAVTGFAPYFDDILQKYREVLAGIGGYAQVVNSYDDIRHHINADFAGARRIVSFDKKFASFANVEDGANRLHQFADVDVCIVSSNLAVAENGAVWITDKNMPERVLPFIAQSLVAVIHKENIVATMHDAYEKIADADYGFATFIAGPSKTADIEQSLVLGAHGPKTMTVFIVD